MDDQFKKWRQQKGKRVWEHYRSMQLMHCTTWKSNLLKTLRSTIEWNIPKRPAQWKAADRHSESLSKWSPARLLLSVVRVRNMDKHQRTWRVLGVRKIFLVMLLAWGGVYPGQSPRNCSANTQSYTDSYHLPHKHNLNVKQQLIFTFENHVPIVFTLFLSLQFVRSI